METYKKVYVMEMLRFIFSSFWICAGCLTLIIGGFSSLGWCINAIILGIKGIKCDSISIIKIN